MGYHGFAKLRLHILSAFTTYTPCLRTLHALLHDLRTLHALFTHLKVFLGWICSPPKTLKFPKNIKDITNRAAFMQTERQS